MLKLRNYSTWILLILLLPLSAKASFEKGLLDTKVSLPQLKQALIATYVMHDSDSTNPILKIEPIWDKAFSSTSKSGREIIVVPVSDQSLTELNGGHVQANLIFSRSGPDSIFTQIMITVANPAYGASEKRPKKAAPFSGAVVFFDLYFNFQYGLLLEKGKAVDYVDTVTLTASANPASISNKSNGYAHIKTGEASKVSKEGNAVLGFVFSCNDFAKLDASSTEKNTWLAPLQEKDKTETMRVHKTAVPVNLFSAPRKQKPFDSEKSDYKQLLELQHICQFNQRQFAWASSNAGLVPNMLNLLNQHKDE